MRTKTIEIYRFEELSDDAKARARDWWRKTTDGEIHWQEEIFDSFTSVFEESGLRITNYSLSMEAYRSYVRFDINNSVGLLSGARALAWLENNLFNNLRITRKEYLAKRKDYFCYGYRIGKIKPCPLTGYCADEVFLEALVKNVLDGNCLKDAYASLADTYAELIADEYADQNSDHYINDLLIANDYEFTENGELA